MPLVDSKLTKPAPPFIESKKETPTTKAIPSEIEELPAQAKPEPPLVKLKAEPPPEKAEPPPEKAKPPLEKTEPPPAKAEPSLALPLTEESPSTPAQESRSISPPAPSPQEEFVATPREEIFPEGATQLAPQPQVSYPSPPRMPRWIWAAVGAVILVLLGSFFVWRNFQQPKMLTREVTPVQGTPSITRLTLDIESVGKSPTGKQVFPKHVRAFINDTPINLKGADNHWSIDFGGKASPLPFDLEVSAPGYQLGRATFRAH